MQIHDLERCGEQDSIITVSAGRLLLGRRRVEYEWLFNGKLGWSSLRTLLAVHSIGGGKDVNFGES